MRSLVLVCNIVGVLFCCAEAPIQFDPRLSAAEAIQLAERWMERNGYTERGYKIYRVEFIPEGVKFSDYEEWIESNWWEVLSMKTGDLTGKGPNKTPLVILKIDDLKGEVSLRKERTASGEETKVPSRSKTD